MIDIQTAITRAKVNLEFARLEGDKLTIQLAEDGLNDLLDKFSIVTGVTKVTETGEGNDLHQL